MKVIYGRAGSGKSEFIFNNIKNNKDAQVYIITPEQFSFSAEKRLVESLGNDAVLKYEVISFERMAYRVMNEIGIRDIHVMDKAAKAMIVHSIVEKNRKKFNFAGSSTDNVEMLITQITEFKKHGITLSMVENQIKNISDQYLKLKLKDMLLVYREFEKFSEGYIDENNSLNILAENLSATHLFDNSVIYIDEFAGFTRQEYVVIQELNKVAKDIVITICSDDDRVTKSPDSDVFYDNKQTLQTLKQLFDDIEILEISGSKRFKNGELVHLEQNLFGVPYHKFNGINNNISIYSADNAYDEIENVCKKIFKLVRDKGYRYRDIAVISNNLDSYASLIKVISDSYDIPIFMDEKVDITQNVFIKYLISILDIFSKNWSYESVFNYLKTGFVKVDNIDEIENYCLKWGIKGKRWYEKPWNYEINNFEEQQKQIVEPLLNLKDKLSSQKNVKLITEELYKFIVDNVEIDSEDEEFVEYFNIVVELLNTVIRVFGNLKINFDDYIKLLKVGLKEKEVSKIPDGQDRVIFGTVDRTKANEIKVVFIIGVNEGVFPSNNTSEGFFNDLDRANLKNNGFEIAKGLLEKSYEENFNIYRAFTTAQESVYVSYSLSDNQGGMLRKSMFISRLKSIFPKLEEERSSDKLEILNKNVTFNKLLNNIDKSEWFDVYRWFLNNDENKLNASLRGLSYTNIPVKLKQENVDKLYGNKLNTTITRLEKYANCPYSYFMQYGLKIADKEEFELKKLDTGSFVHAVVDEFFKTVDINEITDDEIDKIVDDIITNEISQYIKFSMSAKFKIMVQRVKKFISLSIKYIVQGLKNSDFRVLGTEVSFGNKSSSSNDEIVYPPIEFEIGNGKRVSITGKIDRIDVAEIPSGDSVGKYIRIIDYKSSVKDLDLNKIFNGLQLQLITYIDAVCYNEAVDKALQAPINPAGVLYFNLIEPIIKNRCFDDESIVRQIKEAYRMQGFIVSDLNIPNMMDKDFDPAGKSEYFKYNSKGRNGKDIMIDKENFKNLQKYTKKTLKEISKAIMKGNIDIKPISFNGKNIPCQYCQYKSICQFNPKFKNNKYKFIESKSRDDVFEQIKLDLDSEK